MIETSRGLRRAIAAGAEAWNSFFPGSLGGERISGGRALSTDAVGGYYLDYTPKTRGPDAAAPERLPSVGVIQLALGWWEGTLGAPGRQNAKFLDSCELALARAERHGDALLWPVLTAVAKYGLRPPWHSALLQGQAASIFVRAHHLTGDPAWGAAARAAVSPLLEPSGELVTATACGPILEEAPSTPASHILNGWISALWGVRDVAVAQDDERARAVFDGSLQALRHHLAAYDTGWWTLYSLYPHPVEDLAKPIYQAVHADQIDVLHQLTGICDFRDAAARWRGYRHPAATVAVIAQKALFTAVDRHRRESRFRQETR